MQKMMRNRLQSPGHSRGWWWIALFFLVAQPAFSVTFTASLDRSSVVLGEQVVLTLKFNGGQPQEFSNPSLDGLRIVSSPSQSASVESTSTNRSVVYTYAISIAPLRAGDLVIPAITAKINGQVLTSQPLKLKVAASDSTAPPAEYGDKIAFLWVVLPKTNLFINEPVVAEIRIYLRSDVHRYGDLQMSPDGNGLTFGKLVEGQQYSRRVGNASFTVVPLSVAITPVRTGPASFNGINGSIVLNNRDPMEFGGFFGNSGTPQQAPLTSPQIDLQISPLPSDNVPPGFNGAVGTYTMEVSVGPTNLVAGDPITLRVQVSGRGALDVLSLPELTGWDNFKAYPPTSKVNPSDAFGIEGSKMFEEIVTPLSSDVRAVPAFSFSFFDPETKKFQTLTHPATPLVVRAATPGAMPAAATHSEASGPTADVVPIRQHLGTLAQINPPLVQEPWFLALQGVPVFALLTSVVWRKRRESLANNPRLRRQRQVAQLVRDGLLQLQTLAADNNSNDFFATLFRLLQEQLGERLDLPAIAITEAVIEDRLRPGGLDEDTLALLHELFHTCNLARYAPIQSSQELAAIIPKLETAVNQLRTWEA